MPYRRIHVGMRNTFEVRGDIVAMKVMANRGVEMETIFDLADLEIVRAVKGRWRATDVKRNGSKYYVIAEVWTGSTERTYTSLHRLIMQPPDNMLVDHRDGDTMNNRRLNLRWATYTVNNLNRHVARSDSSTGVRGVYPRKGSKRFLAAITINHQSHTVGWFDTVEEGDVAVKAFLREKGY